MLVFFNVYLFSPGSLRILRAKRLCRKDTLRPKFAQAEQLDANRHKANAYHQTPMPRHWDAKAAACLHKFPPFLLSEDPNKTMGTVWPSSEWAGLTRPAVSWGSLVCSGVDVYISGRTHCFDKAPRCTHTVTLHVNYEEMRCNFSRSLWRGFTLHKQVRTQTTDAQFHYSTLTTSFTSGK